MGSDHTLPAPRSEIQMVSPAGSTPVGVLSQSLITVTLASCEVAETALHYVT
jgi:hypothetical protein